MTANWKTQVKAARYDQLLDEIERMKDERREITAALDRARLYLFAHVDGTFDVKAKGDPVAAKIASGNPPTIDDVAAVIKPRGVYGEWCHDPKLCADKGCCPRDPTCGD